MVQIMKKTANICVAISVIMFDIFSRIEFNSSNVLSSRVTNC